MSNTKNTNDINIIVSNFHGKIFKILKICKKIRPNNIELEQLHSRLSLARDVDPLLIINRCKDKMWLYRDYILERNEKFFLDNGFTQYIKDDDNKSFMHSLIDLIKSGYKSTSTEEKDILWSLAQDMLRHVIEYKKAIGDFSR
jgi:hypothetical protein